MLGNLPISRTYPDRTLLLTLRKELDDLREKLATAEGKISKRARSALSLRMQDLQEENSKLRVDSRGRSEEEVGNC